VNAYLQSLARGLINNPTGDLVPFAWTLTESFNRVFAGDFPPAAGDDNGLGSNTWGDFTGDLDWQQAVATPATTPDRLPTAAPQASAAMHQQQATAWDECFALMAAATDDHQQPAEDD
jgi:hypothetical protein